MSSWKSFSWNIFSEVRWTLHLLFWTTKTKQNWTELWTEPDRSKASSTKVSLNIHVTHTRTTRPAYLTPPTLLMITIMTPQKSLVIIIYWSQSRCFSIIKENFSSPFLMTPAVVHSQIMFRPGKICVMWSHFVESGDLSTDIVGVGDVSLNVICFNASLYVWNLFPFSTNTACICRPSLDHFVRRF